MCSVGDPGTEKSSCGLPRVNVLGVYEFEEVQLHYSQFTDTLGYDISTKKTKQAETPQ